jgi:hypothetical protein
MAIPLSAANTHDATQLLPLVDAIPSIIGPRGRPRRPRKHPGKLHADKAYDASDLRRSLRTRSIIPPSLVVASTPRRAWVGTAGWSSGRCPGFWVFATWACAMTGALICSKGYSTSPAHCSA